MLQFEYKYQEDVSKRLVLDEKEIQTCIDYFFTESKIRQNISNTGEDKQFGIILLDIMGNDFLESLFPKELANLISTYNGDYYEYIIKMNGQNTPNYYYKTNVHVKNRNFYQHNKFVLTLSIERQIVQTTSYIDHIRMCNKIFDIVCKKQMSCLTHIINNNMFSSFINMEYDELYSACTRVSKNILNIRHYPIFFIFMFRVVSEKQFHDVIIANVIYNMIKDKLEKIDT